MSIRMNRTRSLLQQRSAVLLTALYIAVYFCHYQHASAVKLDRTGSCWATYPSRVLEATSDTSAPSSQPFYRILNKIDETVYIGGRETLIEVSLVNNTVNTKMTRFETMEPADLVVTCAVQHPDNNETVCHNFIRIAEITSSGHLLVCGTNARSQRCYSCIDSSCNTLNSNYTQLAVVPKLPDVNAAAAIFKNDTVDMLYGGGQEAGTFNRLSVNPDLSATDPIQFERDTVTVGEGFIKDATFIGRPFEYTHDDGNEYVFLIYREIALEYVAGTRVYSRIARVCKNDPGGTTNTMKFVTFIKARLECSVPNDDDPAFEYNYVQDAVWDATNSTLYAIFTDQENGPSTSALCSYRMEDILNLFDNGIFQQQVSGNVNALWTEVTPTPTPRPGMCNAVHTTDYPPLLHKSVPNYNAMERTGDTQDSPPDNLPTSDPPIIQVDNVRFTSLAVDLNYTSPVYFVGTSAGNVIKFTSEECDGVNTIKSVELTEFNANGPINGLELLRSSDLATFLVGTSDVQCCIEWPLNTKCPSALKEEECGLRNPYCVFINDSECRSTFGSFPPDPPTELTENVLTVLPNSSLEVSACLEDHVYWFCNLDTDDPIVRSANVTLQWEKSNGGSVADGLVSVTYIYNDDSKQLPQVAVLDVIVQNSTLGSYECTLNAGGRIVTKQAEILLKTDCLTRDNICSRMEEYNTLKSQNDDLRGQYGNNQTMCYVKPKNCNDVGLTCPASP